MDSLYREEMMEIYKDPKHKKELPNANAYSEEENPLCGDTIKLRLKIKNGKIQSAAFEGSSCAVSTISTEKVLGYVEGKSIEEAKNLTQEKLLDLLDIDISMSRVRCATLVLTALKNALESFEEGNE